MSYRGKIKNQTTWEIEKRKNGKKRETKLNWIGEDREKNKVAIIKSSYYIWLHHINNN